MSGRMVPVSFWLNQKTCVTLPPSTLVLVHFDTSSTCFLPLNHAELFPKALASFSNVLPSCSSVVLGTIADSEDMSRYCVLPREFPVLPLPSHKFSILADLVAS